MGRSIDLQLYLFVAGYLVEHIGNGVMIYKLHKQKTMYGVSIDTQICLMMAAVARVFWMWDTQLTKLTISMIEIIMAVALHAYIILLCYQFKDTIYKGVKEFFLKFPFLIGTCFILSLIFHPGSKGDFFFTL